jgi:ferredoxin-NADP reductase
LEEALCSLQSFILNVQQFLAGQWLDVHIPGIPKPGGFTITSTPMAAMFVNRPLPRSDGRSQHAGYLELAVQKSPDNPPAAWLWRPVPEILGQELQVRVGGSFVWPPPNVDMNEVKRVVLVAGGVGINPFMSMVGVIGKAYGKSYHVTVLYSVKDPGDHRLSSVLYLESLAKLFKVEWVKGELVLHLTSGEKGTQSPDDAVELAGYQMKCRRRRITKEDLLSALGNVEEARSTVVYICGVPLMTDELVEVAQQAAGMDPKRVLCERWW